MSAAEAEIAKLSETFDVNLTTDFGEIESVIQQRIDQNRGKVRVAADLSKKGIAEIKAEERMQGAARRAGAAELRGRARAQVAGDDAGRADGEGPRAGDREGRREADQLEQRTSDLQTALEGVDIMANGQPRPAFYVAVLLVVARPRRPRALALRRDRHRRRPGRADSRATS